MSDERVAIDRSRWLAVAVGIVALAVVLFLSPLFGAGEPPGLDLPIHLAEIQALSRSLVAGDLGLWNPSANLGFASGYYYQLLPQLVVAGIHALLGGAVSLLVLFKLAIVVPLALLPATGARALLIAGASRAGALAAAIAIATVFAAPPWGLGGDAVLRTGLFTQPWGLLFYPLALAYAARFVRERRDLRRAVGYGLACGLCHPFVAFCLAPALAVILPTQRAPGLGRAAGLLAILVAASAFAWLPILVDAGSFGGFPSRLPEEAGLGGRELTGLLLGGRLLDEGRLPILTAAALAAVPVALWRRKGLLATLVIQAALFAALIVVAPIVGPVAGDLVPGIRFLAPLQLALAAAAGLLVADAGAAAAARWGRPGRMGAGVVSAILAVLLGVGAAGRFAALTRTLADEPAVHRDELAVLLAALAALPPGRIATARALGSSGPAWSYLPAVYAGKPALRAYGGAALQSSTNYLFLRAADPRATARLYDIRYAFARRASLQASDRVLATSEHFALIGLDGDGLFAAIGVTGGLPAERELRQGGTWPWLGSDAPARGEHLAIGEPTPRLTHAPGRVLTEAEAPSRYTAEVDAAGDHEPTTFVLRVTYHPGWRATIDGAAAPVRRVTPDFIAVDVPPGRHALELRFVRPLWTWLLLIGCVGVGAFAFFRKRRQRAEFVQSPENQ